MHGSAGSKFEHGKFINLLSRVFSFQLLDGCTNHKPKLSSSYPWCALFSAIMTDSRSLTLLLTNMRFPSVSVQTNRSPASSFKAASFFQDDMN